MWSSRSLLDVLRPWRTGASEPAPAGPVGQRPRQAQLATQRTISPGVLRSTAKSTRWWHQSSRRRVAVHRHRGGRGPGVQPPPDDVPTATDLMHRYGERPLLRTLRSSGGASLFVEAARSGGDVATPRLSGPPCSPHYFVTRSGLVRIVRARHRIGTTIGTDQTSTDKQLIS